MGGPKNVSRVLVLNNPLREFEQKYATQCKMVPIVILMVLAKFANSRWFLHISVHSNTICLPFFLSHAQAICSRSSHTVPKASCIDVHASISKPINSLIVPYG